MEDLQQVILLDTQIKEDVSPISGLTCVSRTGPNFRGPTGGARELYIRYMKQDDRLRGLIYYGLSSFFKMAVKIAGRTNIFKFKLAVVDKYDQAVTLAENVLSGVGAVSEPDVPKGPAALMVGEHREESSSQVVAREEWWSSDGGLLDSV